VSTTTIPGLFSALTTLTFTTWCTLYPTSQKPRHPANKQRSEIPQTSCWVRDQQIPWLTERTMLTRGLPPVWELRLLATRGSRFRRFDRLTRALGNRNNREIDGSASRGKRDRSIIWKCIPQVSPVRTPSSIYAHIVAYASHEIQHDPSRQDQPQKRVDSAPENLEFELLAEHFEPLIHASTPSSASHHRRSTRLGLS